MTTAAGLLVSKDSGATWKVVGDIEVRWIDKLTAAAKTCWPSCDQSASSSWCSRGSLLHMHKDMCIAGDRQAGLAARPMQQQGLLSCRRCPTGCPVSNCALAGRQDVAGEPGAGAGQQGAAHHDVPHRSRWVGGAFGWLVGSRQGGQQARQDGQQAHNPTKVPPPIDR